MAFGEAADPIARGDASDVADGVGKTRGGGATFFSAEVDADDAGEECVGPEHEEADERDEAEGEPGGDTGLKLGEGEESEYAGQEKEEHDCSAPAFHEAVAEDSGGEDR